jgi:putative PIN family toxin of toxin-antitoxin system
LLDFFDAYADFIEVSSKIKKCRDPKDDFLLSLAVDSKADYLLTGDNDLLDLKRVGKTKIITFTDFIMKI